MTEAPGPAGQELARRLEQLEAYRDLQQLAARYALAVDAKDVAAVVELFVPDVNAGAPWGRGRPALAAFFRDALSHFYRSAHLIAGHVIDVEGPERASGVVHCRAEHEAGSAWGIMVMNYRDDYERQEGRWFFRRRRLQVLYTTDLRQVPRGPDFNQGWEGMAERQRAAPPRLPAEYPTFGPFWREFPPGHVQRLTVDPLEPPGAP